MLYRRLDYDSDFYRLRNICNPSHRVQYNWHKRREIGGMIMYTNIDYLCHRCKRIRGDSSVLHNIETKHVGYQGIACHHAGNRQDLEQEE